MKKLKSLLSLVVMALAIIVAVNTTVANKGTPVKALKSVDVPTLVLTSENIAADLSTAGTPVIVPKNSSNNAFFLVEAVVNNNSVNCLPVEKRKSREKNNNNSNVTNTSMLTSLPISEVQWRSSNSFSLNLTSTTSYISPQMGSFVILKTELQGVAKEMVGTKFNSSLTRAFMYSLGKNSKEGMVCRQKIWPNNANETSDFFNLTSTMPTCRTLGGNTFSSISGFTVAAISKV